MVSSMAPRGEIFQHASYKRRMPPGGVNATALLRALRVWQSEREPSRAPRRHIGELAEVFGLPPVAAAPALLRRREVVPVGEHAHLARRSFSLERIALQQARDGRAVLAQRLQKG